MKILVLDNYDSFTYNLVQYLKELKVATIEVFRNDAIALEAVANYDAIVLSPGPGLPADAGIMPAIIRKYGHQIPVLGICLGHQAIAEAYGAQLHNIDKVYHGVATPIQVLSQRGIFKGQAKTLTVGRYHSWIVQQQGLPECLQVTAVDAEDVIMAFRHKDYPVYGLQFHPESVLTPKGKQLLHNFISLVDQTVAIS